MYFDAYQPQVFVITFVINWLCISFTNGLNYTSYYLFHINTGNDLWPEEVKHKGCPNHDPNHGVSSQKECQQECIANPNCVGISYSYKDISKSYCYVCKDEELTAATNNFGFYRRPAML